MRWRRGKTVLQIGKKKQIKQQINKLCVVRYYCCMPKSVISYKVYQRGWNVYTSVEAKFLLGELSSIFLNPFGSFYWRKKKGLPCAEALDRTWVGAHALSLCMVPIWKRVTPTCAAGQLSTEMITQDGRSGNEFQRGLEPLWWGGP